MKLMMMASIAAASLLAGSVLIARVDTARAGSEEHTTIGARPAAQPAAQATQTTQAAPPGAEVRPRIVGISHVAFRVSSMPAARAFYADVLGLMALGPEKTGAGTERLRFRVSNRQHVVLESGLPADDDERLSHLAFETSDLDVLRAYLKAHGIEAEAAPPAPARACSSRALWVKDPDGHPIEFVDSFGNGAPPANTNRRITGGVEPISQRVLHAGLTIRDAEAADRFYKTVLGFSEIWRGGRTDSEISWINMKVPDGTDYLEYMLVSGPVTRQQRGSMHHVALLVPDMQQAYEVAQRRTPPEKLATMASPQIGRNRRWQLNLFDPDGTRTELMEPFPMR